MPKYRTTRVAYIDGSLRQPGYIIDSKIELKGETVEKVDEKGGRKAPAGEEQKPEGESLV